MEFFGRIFRTTSADRRIFPTPWQPLWQANGLFRGERLLLVVPVSPVSVWVQSISYSLD